MTDSMTLHDEALNILADFDTRCPAGYAVGLHLQFTTSKYIFQHYSIAWMQEYSRRGLILVDPTVKWGVANEGWIRWSELSAIDEAGVLSAASEFGLNFGVSISIAESSGRSLGSFAATEKEFREGEIADLAAGLKRLHEIAGEVAVGSETDMSLKKFAATLGHG
jgi:LuxR family transcriptional regulator, quorum-sensing system regulator SdiA